MVRQEKTQEGLNPPALPKLCYLWNSLIHKESPNHCKWGTVVAGLWAEEVSDEPSWLGIWIQDLISGLSKPALFLYLKAKTNRPVRFLNQSHSGESSGVDTRREPPMASLLIQCYFWGSHPLSLKYFKNFKTQVPRSVWMENWMSFCKSARKNKNKFLLYSDLRKIYVLSTR